MVGGEVGLFQFVDDPCSIDGDVDMGVGRDMVVRRRVRCYWLPKYCTEYSSEAGRRGKGRREMYV